MPPKNGLNAFRSSLFAKSQLIQAVGMPSAKSNRSSGSNFRVVTMRLLGLGCQEKSQEKVAVSPVLGKEGFTTGFTTENTEGTEKDGLARISHVQ